MSLSNGISRLVVLVLLAGASLHIHAAGDPVAGKAQSVTCAACHGQDGATAIDPSYPNLAGQNEKYLTRQLEMFQSGARDVALMTAQLIGKSEQDLADLVEQYEERLALDEALKSRKGRNRRKHGKV